MPRGELFAKRQMHVFKIGAGAVQQHDRRSAGRRRSPISTTCCGKAAGIDEAAARPMPPLDQPRADEGDDGASAQHRNDNDERGHQVRLSATITENVTSVAGRGAFTALRH